MALQTRGSEASSASLVADHTLVRAHLPVITSWTDLQAGVVEQVVHDPGEVLALAAVQVVHVAQGAGLMALRAVVAS